MTDLNKSILCRHTFSLFQRAEDLKVAARDLKITNQCQVNSIFYSAFVSGYF